MFKEITGLMSEIEEQQQLNARLEAGRNLERHKEFDRFMAAELKRMKEQMTVLHANEISRIKEEHQRELKSAILGRQS